MTFDKMIDKIIEDGEIPISVIVVSAKPKEDSEYINVYTHADIFKLVNKDSVIEVYVTELMNSISEKINSIPQNDKTKTAAREEIKKAWSEYFC